MACYKLEEYETALEAFEQGSELTDAHKNPQFSIWAQKCRIALAGRPRNLKSLVLSVGTCTVRNGLLQHIGAGAAVAASSK
jgi:hypothetical protein